MPSRKKVNVPITRIPHVVPASIVTAHPVSVTIKSPIKVIPDRTHAARYHLENEDHIAVGMCFNKEKAELVAAAVNQFLGFTP